MVVKNKGMKKMYVFYVSEFHLEMILLPFVNKKIEENENIIIKTEYDLKETLQVLLSKMNLKKENKEKILKLNWNKNDEKNISDKSNVIIVGDKKYIDNVNDQIAEKNFGNITILDCYKLEEIKDNMNNIVSKYDCNLNTSGINIQKN